MEIRKYIGGQTKPDALYRTGKLITFRLSKRDFGWLKSLAKEMQMNYSDVLRYLIANEFLANKEADEKYLELIKK
jgi:hypothetical protein